MVLMVILLWYYTPNALSYPLLEVNISLQLNTGYPTDVLYLNLSDFILNVQPFKQ